MQASGEGNGNPLQHSCLENPRGAWQDAVYGVAQSRTRLKQQQHQHASFTCKGLVSCIHTAFFFSSVEGSKYWFIKGKCTWYLEVGKAIFLSICSVYSLVLCMCLISPQQVVWVNAHGWSAFCKLQGLHRGWDLAGSNMSQVRRKHTGGGVSWKLWLLDQSRGIHTERGRTRKVADDHCKNQMLLLEAVVLLVWERCTSSPLIPSGPWIPGFPASASCMAAASPRTPSSAQSLPPHLPDPGKKGLSFLEVSPAPPPSQCCIHSFFASLIQVQLNYNIILDSGVQQTDSVSLQIILHQKLLQDKGCNPCAVQYILVIYLFCVLIKRSMSFLVPSPALASPHPPSP